jgi:hypothetical protein
VTECETPGGASSASRLYIKELQYSNKAAYHQMNDLAARQQYTGNAWQVKTWRMRRG